MALVIPGVSLEDFILDLRSVGMKTRDSVPEPQAGRRRVRSRTLTAVVMLLALLAFGFLALLAQPALAATAPARSCAIAAPMTHRDHAGHLARRLPQSRRASTDAFDRPRMY